MRFQDIFASRWTVGFFFSTTRDFSIFGIFKYRWIFIAFIFVTGFVLFFFGVSRIGRFLFSRCQDYAFVREYFFFFLFFPPIYLHMFFRMKMIGHRKDMEKLGGSLCFVETISISIFRINDISNNATLFLYNA